MQRSCRHDPAASSLELFRQSFIQRIISNREIFRQNNKKNDEKHKKIMKNKEKSR